MNFAVQKELSCHLLRGLFTVERCVMLSDYRLFRYLTALTGANNSSLSQKSKRKATICPLNLQYGRVLYSFQQCVSARKH